MKRLMVVMMFLMLSLCSLAAADKPFGVFVNSNTNSVQLLDPETNTATPNYLGGELGSYGGGLFDVVITPDGKTAIVSNFGDSKIFFIDISGGFNAAPKPLFSKRIGFFAEDMAICCKYLLITDGGFSNRIGVLNLETFKLTVILTGNKYANAVECFQINGICLVVTADYFSGALHFYTLNCDTGDLVFLKTIRISPFRPVNVNISPDGKTGIAVIAGSSACVTFYVDNAGVPHYSKVVSMPFKNGQSCVFNKAGDKAYYLSNSQTGGTKVVVLNVTGPGQVSPSGINIKIWPKRGTSQLFGVDSIALDPDEKFLYVTNPTLSGGICDVAVVDLTLPTPFQVGYIPAKGIPTGIAFTPLADED